jgi:hypothetical protein
LANKLNLQVTGGAGCHFSAKNGCENGTQHHQSFWQIELLFAKKKKKKKKKPAPFAIVVYFKNI